MEKPFVDFALGSLKNLKGSTKLESVASRNGAAVAQGPPTELIARDRVRQRGDLRPARQNAAGIQFSVCTCNLVRLRTVADRKFACKQGRLHHR